MQETKTKPYYLQWICVAFSHGLGISDLVGAVIGLIVYFAYEFFGTMMVGNIDINLWVLIGVLGGIVLVRLILAPYWIYKGQENTIVQLSQKLKSKTAQEIFAIESDGEEFGEPSASGYPESKAKRILRIDLSLTAIPGKSVESVQLELLGHLIPTDWQPDYVSGVPTGGYYYFDIPDSIKQGKYTVKLIAFADGERFESKPFEIEVPK